MFGIEPFSSSASSSAPLYLSASPTGGGTMSGAISADYQMSGSFTGTADASLILGRLTGLWGSFYGAGSIVASINLQAGMSAVMQGGGQLSSPELHRTRRFDIAFIGAAFMEVDPISAFDRLLTDPSARRLYTVEISAVMTIAYGDQ